MILFYSPSLHDRLFEFRKSDLKGFDYNELESSTDIVAAEAGIAAGHDPDLTERVSEEEEIRMNFRESLLKVLRVFNWKKFWRNLWEEIFSFDDKDVIDDPVDFGHTAFVEEPQNDSQNTGTGGHSRTISAAADNNNVGIIFNRMNSSGSGGHSGPLMERNRAKTLATVSSTGGYQQSGSYYNSPSKMNRSASSQSLKCHSAGDEESLELAKDSILVDAKANNSRLKALSEASKRSGRFPSFSDSEEK